MNDLIRPALYGAHHEIIPVTPPAETAGGSEVVDIVGPVCETGDFFARDRELPAIQERDLLAILDAGAYGMVLSSNYNTRPRAAEVLVDGKNCESDSKKRKGLGPATRAADVARHYSCRSPHLNLLRST